MYSECIAILVLPALPMRLRTRHSLLRLLRVGDAEEVSEEAEDAIHARVRCCLEGQPWQGH